MKQLVRLYLGLSTLIIVACGGSNGNDPLVDPGAEPDPDDRSELLTWQQGLFLDRDVYANFCAQPRTGLDQFNDNEPYPDRQGTTADENFFLRSWTNDLYLWYQEVPDQNPNNFTTVEYFNELRTRETTPSGRPKDNFHFSQDTESYKTRTESGVVFGYGMDYVFLSTSPPRELLIQDVLPDSPADQAGVARGMSILEIDGVDLINGSDTDTLNNGLFPSVEGEPHTFVMRLPDGSGNQTFMLSSASLDTQPVKDVARFSTPTGDVGYIHFNAHTFPSERGLFDAFSTLASGGGVTDLILDLRYNGGGLLAIAAQAGYMVAGSPRTEGLTFYRTQFNDKYPNTDPVNGGDIRGLEFIDEGIGFDGALPSGTQLPTLDLPRVFVISTAGTCSASEAIINGLLGADIEVILIGSTTCGKPYGFYPQDNCGETYFSVQFAGVNEKGFGEYSDGFSPANEPNAPGIPVVGCFVADDFSKSLGDPTEGMVATALQYREEGSCPPIPSASSSRIPRASQKGSVQADGLELSVPFEPGVNNAILLPPERW